MLPNPSSLPALWPKIVFYRMGDKGARERGNWLRALVAPPEHLGSVTNTQLLNSSSQPSLTPVPGIWWSQHSSHVVQRQTHRQNTHSDKNVRMGISKRLPNYHLCMNNLKLQESEEHWLWKEFWNLIRRQGFMYPRLLNSSASGLYFPSAGTMRRVKIPGVYVC